MEAKLRQLMKHEGINSTRLAEILGIQASGISHIMSGRNKPSFDFLLKLLQRFPQINPDWLLLDKGPMYRDEIKNKGGQNSPAGAGTRPGGSGGTGGTGISGGTGGTGISGGAVGIGGMFGAGVGSAGGASGGMAGDINPPYHPGGAEGAGGTGGPGNAGPGGELFGHDNNDIIPSGGRQSGNFAGNPDGYSGRTPQASDGGQAGQYSTPHSAALNATPVTNISQQAGYQSGGFTRSALIERIVVFYKDKTFSEYQPE